MVDAHNEQEEDILWLKTKVTDLEDHSRKNNIKITCKPETVKPSELMSFLTT